MLASPQRCRLAISHVPEVTARIERCRVWFAIALYVLTSVVWPFEPVSGSDGCGSGTKIGRRSDCCCSAEKKSNGTCCCAKSTKTVSIELPRSVLPKSDGLSGKRCCAPAAAKASPSESKSCCETKAAKTPKQLEPIAYGWSACDCPTEPGSTLAPVFQPRVCSQTRFAWMPVAQRAALVAPTLCWMGAELEPATPPPKIVL
ncbi:MAG: hypothetical protein NT013_16710 [Planctomycetia bacterium]|nr:hypothetical protein [Planctomycetia bacterium]